MTEVFVDERGILRVPLTPHTCNEFIYTECDACEEMLAYWASFEAMPINVRIIPKATQLSWDEAFDAHQEVAS